METLSKSITSSLTKQKFLIYNTLFLTIAFLIAMGQNYLKYGASPHYKPTRSALYLLISLLFFIPLLPVVLQLAAKLKQYLEQHYWQLSAILIVLAMFVFFISSNALMHLFGYYDGWFNLKYAKSYLGREAIWHMISLLVCFIYIKYQSSSTLPKLITCSQGRKKVSISPYEIHWVETDDHYLKVHTQTETLLKRATLDSLSTELAPEFIRIHRRYLVNQREIARLEKENRADFVILTNGERLKVGKSYTSQLKTL